MDWWARHQVEDLVLSNDEGGCVGERWTDIHWEHHHHVIIGGPRFPHAPMPSVPCREAALPRTCPTPAGIPGSPREGQIVGAGPEVPRLYCDAHWAGHLAREEAWLEAYGPVAWAWDKTVGDEVFHPDALPCPRRPGSRWLGRLVVGAVGMFVVLAVGVVGAMIMGMVLFGVRLFLR